MNIIIIGNTNNFDIAISLLKNENIKIIAGIVDSSNEQIQAKQKLFLKNNNIKEIQFSDVTKYSADICLILSFSKIIPTEVFKNTILLNIHGGILPKWRGINSNAWAIINGENEVGYTLHKASEILDGGDIYFVYKQKIQPGEKYGEIIPKLREGIAVNLPDILKNIISGDLKPVSQEGANYVYTSKLRIQDGIISDWNRPSAYFYNLYRVMSSPYGTGIYFKYKDLMYEIKELSLDASFCNYICIPGAIVSLGENYMCIKTGDNVIKVSSITLDNKEVNIQKTFKIGMRL